VGITLRPREAAAAAGLGPELEEVLARREPAQLRPVLPELCAAEERLIHQRLVREIPVVRVNLVEIAGAGEETSALEREAVAERERLEIRLFDIDAVVPLIAALRLVEEYGFKFGGQRRLVFL